MASEPTWNLWHGDCRDMLKEIPENSVDAAVITPPSPIGLLGQGWNRDSLALNISFWWQVHRVLKPGAFASVQCQVSVYHKIACSMEDGGFHLTDYMEFVDLFGLSFLARKPLSEPTLQLNVDRWGVGFVKPRLEIFEPHLRIAPLGGTILDPFARNGADCARYFHDGFSVLMAERDRFKVAEIEKRMAATAAILGIPA